MTRARELADNSQGTKPKVIDAKGDLIAGTASDTAAKVTVGANGTFLKANSSQTAGVEWATVVTDPLPTTFLLGGM
jgi:pectate lyase